MRWVVGGLLSLFVLGGVPAAAQNAESSYDPFADEFATIRDLVRCSAYHKVLSERLTATEKPQNAMLAFDVGRDFMRAAVFFAATRDDADEDADGKMIEDTMQRELIVQRALNESGMPDTDVRPICASMTGLLATMNDEIARARYNASKLP